MTGKSPGGKRRTLTGLLVILSLGAGIFFLVRGCAGNISPDVANLAFKTGEKTYVYSNLGSTLVKMSLDKNESPAAMAFSLVYKDGENYFVEPNNMQAIVDVMSGNIKFFEYQEKNCNGYITSDTGRVYSLEMTYESTEKIGEQLMVYRVNLKNKNKSHQIDWTFNSKTGESEALKNCKVKSFWIQTNPSPGETVVSSRDFLVVDLKELARFYSCSIEYDPETRVLYVVK